MPTLRHTSTSLNYSRVDVCSHWLNFVMEMIPFFTELRINCTGPVHMPSVLSFEGDREQ